MLGLPAPPQNANGDSTHHEETAHVPVSLRTRGGGVAVFFSVHPTEWPLPDSGSSLHTFAVPAWAKCCDLLWPPLPSIAARKNVASGPIKTLHTESPVELHPWTGESTAQFKTLEAPITVAEGAREYVCGSAHYNVHGRVVFTRTGQEGKLSAGGTRGRGLARKTEAMAHLHARLGNDPWLWPSSRQG